MFSTRRDGGRRALCRAVLIVACGPDPRVGGGGRPPPRAPGGGRAVRRMDLRAAAGRPPGLAIEV
eukprot:6163269-Lingulodinium_polyedra.AAC.1